MTTLPPPAEFGIGLTDKCAELTVDDIRAMAAARGYDLVPRMTAQQAHDELLSKRVAEDGPPPVTSAPGWDGRYRPLTCETDDRGSDLSMGR